MKQVIQPAAGAEFNNRFGFSAAVKSAPFIFLSGQVGSDADGNVPDDPEAQFVNAFTKLGSVLKAAGAGFDDIVEMTTYHVGMRDHIQDFVAVKSTYIREPFPAWTAIGVSELAFPGMIIEIRVIVRQD